MSSIRLSELTDDGLLSWGKDLKELEEKGELVNGCWMGIICRHSVENEIKRRKLHGNLKSGILLYGTLALIGVFVFSKIKNR
jgi:hypothetical protein